MNPLEKQIEEQKKMSTLVNDLIIELQYIQTLTTQVFGKNTESSPEHNDKCMALKNLCDTVEVSLKRLKCIVPTPAIKNEPKA